MGQRVNYKVRELKKWIRVILLLNCGQADLKTDIKTDGMTRYIRYVYEFVYFS